MSDATQQVSEWLSNFGTALDRADFDAAVKMFEEDSYWRDLVSLTWNIITLEGKENIKAMLEATVPGSKPGQWRIEGNATSDNGVISSWFTFETAVSKGKGHIRLKDGKCWTLLTTMTELKGCGEKKGASRPKGVSTRCLPKSANLARAKDSGSRGIGRYQPTLLSYYRWWPRRHCLGSKTETIRCAYHYN